MWNNLIIRFSWAIDTVLTLPFGLRIAFTFVYIFAKLWEVEKHSCDIHRSVVLFSTHGNILLEYPKSEKN
jgi:hypothetical protein